MRGMLNRIISLLIILVLLPATLGRHVDHFRSRRGGSTSFFMRPQQSGRSGRAMFIQKAPVLKMPVMPPSTLTASALANVVLECEAWGNPPPTIHWLKDGKKISQGSSKSTSENQEVNEVVPPVLGMSLTRSKLYLDCLSNRDEASYACVAENPFNRVSSNTQLTVKEAAEDVNPLCLAKKSFGTPARITMWTHNRIEVLGSDVQLFCRSEGLPKPTITWFTPDEVPVSNGEKYKILDNGDLVIHDLAFSDDMGSFTCLAENSQGSDKITTFLYPAQPDPLK